MWEASWEQCVPNEGLVTADTEKLAVMRRYHLYFVPMASTAHRWQFE